MERTEAGGNDIRQRRMFQQANEKAIKTAIMGTRFGESERVESNETACESDR